MKASLKDPEGEKGRASGGLRIRSFRRLTREDDIEIKDERGKRGKVGGISVIMKKQGGYPEERQLRLFGREGKSEFPEK